MLEWAIAAAAVLLIAAGAHAIRLNVRARRQRRYMRRVVGITEWWGKK